MDREYVKELRGDARKDAVDIYNHISKEKLREAYLAAMPSSGCRSSPRPSCAIQDLEV